MDTPIQRTLDVSSKKMELLKLLLKKEGIATSQQSNALSQPPMEAVSRAQPLLLSFAQQRLWFLDQLDPGSVAYTIPLALRLLGPLDLPALHASLHALIQRHEALRTTFDSLAGQLVQQIAADPPLDVPLLDLSALPLEARHTQEHAWLVAAGQTPFDLARGPLLRMQVLRCAAQDHLVHLTFHHIIFDGWSAQLFLRELTTLYLAALTDTPAPLPPLPVQYADYALWQRSWLQGDRLQEQLAYWKQQLRDAPASLDLPTDYPRPSLQTFRGHSLTCTLPVALQAGLERLGQQEGTTLFMTLLAAWQVLLSRYSGQEDVLVGSPIANRGRAEIEGLIGLFVNTLVLRTNLSGNPSFRDVLGRVREVALGAYSHQDVPFEQVVEAVQPPRDASRSPLFQVMFAMETATTTSMTLPGLRVQPVSVEDEVAKFDLSLFVQPGPTGVTSVLEYNSDLFAEATMQRLLEHWSVLVQNIVAQPACPIGHLALLADGERQQLLQTWNATLSPSFGQPLPEGEVYLLDSALQPVPIGVVGEIFLGGVGLARGYWQRPDLTAERFIPHPFSDQPGTRLYRTGDMGRRLVNGTLVLTNGNTLPAPSNKPTEDMKKYISPRDSIELQLVSIWEGLLERTQISITDNFFEIGGHSLLAVMLINQVKSVFKQSIPLVALFRNATIQSFADLLREPEQKPGEVSSALVPIQPQGTKTPLFFIHPVGGEVLCYMELASLLSADHPFYGLRFPFKGEAEQTPLRMEDLAAYYIGVLRTVQPQGPYILGGWSLGGTIAYAMAHQLRIQGEEVPALVFIDSYAPATFTEESDDIHLLLEMVADLGYNMGNALPDIVNQAGFRENIYRRLEQLSPQERLRYIWEQGREIRIIPATLTVSQMQQMFFTFKANIMVVRNYVPVQASQRIILFKPDEGTDAIGDRANGWNSLSARPLEIYTLPGNHYTLLKRPCVEILAEQLKAFL